MAEPVWRRYLRFVRPDLARDVDEELAFHLQMREAEYLARGMVPAEASRLAHERFGRVADARRACLAVDRRRFAAERRLQVVDALGQDLRYGLRTLRQHRVFSAAVVVTLALGIGATTAIFSAVDAALLRPLPFADPGRLVILRGVRVPFAPNGVSAEPSESPDLRTVSAMPDVFSRTAAYAPGGLNMSGDGEALRVNVGLVTTGFFGTLGVVPAMGRGFTDEEGRIGGALVAVLSHGLWQRRYGGVPVLGKAIVLNGHSYEIVGVMPRGFVFPRESDLWIPLTVPATFSTYDAFRSWMPSETVARLAPGVTREAATSRLRELWQRVPAQYRGSWGDAPAHPLSPLQGQLVGDRQKPLWILLVTTGLLLLIACVNVTNLLLARASVRRREIAMRAVLGASRGRLVRQLLVESLLLACGGSAAGLVVAYASLGTVRALMPAGLVATAPPAVDLRVLGFAIGLALLTGLGFGLWPALGAARTNPNETLKSGGGGATTGGAGRVRRALVVAELAVALTLLAGSGLMLRSFKALLDTDPGFRTEHVGTLELTFARAVDDRGEVRRATIEAVLARLRAMPGIEAAGAINDLPLRGGGGLAITVDAEGISSDAQKSMFARYLQASAGYFQALGIPLIRGRLMAESDTKDAPHVVVVSATMAKRLWPGEDPVGRRLLDAASGRGGSRVQADSNAYRTVIGVVADVRESDLESEPDPQMYFPVHEQPPQNVAVVARGTLAPAALLAQLRDAVRAVSPAQPVYNVRTMDEVMFASLTPRRTNTVLITAFGGLALLLSVVGVYGVVAYSVTRRTRELGIRAALGATAADLVRLVAREGAAVALAGVALGLGGAWAFSRALASLLFGVRPTDTATFIAAPLLLFLLVIAATLVPARRAALLNPVDVIRQD